MTTIYQGWTPPVHKVCTRCGQPVDSFLYELCDACHAADEMAEQPPFNGEPIEDIEAWAKKYHPEDADYADLLATQEAALDRGIQ